ncbi:hypothetical protein Hanom_Chr04g00320191 [Helianthus anomalus]
MTMDPTLAYMFPMAGLGVEPDIFNGNANSGISSDGGSCVTEMWPQDAHSPV